MPHRPRQDQYLGALLGLAIGDTLGAPLAGMAPEQIAASGGVSGYREHRFTDGVIAKPGEFSDETEIALCIVESATLGDGWIDAETAAARLQHLAMGESRRWLPAGTANALDVLAVRDQTLVERGDLTADGPDVLPRGIVVGLLHAFAEEDVGSVQGDADLVTRLTHGGSSAVAAVATVASVTRQAVRREIEPRKLAAAVPESHGSAISATLADALEIIGSDLHFEDAVQSAVAAGGAADTRAALVGAILGTAYGVELIPQRLIDGLEGRIYLSLAAPWFYRAAQRRAGLVIDLAFEPPVRPNGR